MRLLLDTHALLWWLADDPALSKQARRLIANEPEVFASAASAWEIAIKRTLGKLEAPEDLPAALDEGGIARLPIQSSTRRSPVRCHGTMTTCSAACWWRRPSTRA